MMVAQTSHPNTTRSPDNCLNQTKVILLLPVEQTQALLTAKMADMKQVSYMFDESCNYLL